MDIGAITSPPLHDAVEAAWAQPVAGEESSSPGEPAAAALTHADLGSKTAVAQTIVRAPTPADQTPTRLDTMLPAAAHALSEFAVPAAQPLPATLVGLQTEQSWTRLLLHPDSPRTGGAADADEPTDDACKHDDATCNQASDAPEEDDAADEVMDAPADDRCEVLARRLSAAFAATPAPRALATVSEQWQRGRCVLVACPQGADPAGPAWAFVLRPRRLPRPAAPGRPLSFALRGWHVDARLHWRQRPLDLLWCHARLVKEHHPQHGRQLIALDEGGAASDLPTCTVQLGPVVVPNHHAAEVCVRIDAVKRLWTALGSQWSVHLLVCSAPLAGSASSGKECEPC